MVFTHNLVDFPRPLFDTFVEIRDDAKKQRTEDELSGVDRLRYRFEDFGEEDHEDGLVSGSSTTPTSRSFPAPYPRYSTDSQTR